LIVLKQENPIRISIITVCRNAESTIADALRSVAKQQFPFIEHIVIDGASDDNTRSIVESFSHVSKIVSEKDNGIYHAMNKGLQLATGDVIGILNADDLYVDDSVLSDVGRLFQDETVDAVYADLVYVDFNNINRVTRSWRAGTYSLKSIYNGWMPPHPTFFVRRSVYEEYGSFNTSLISAADYELMIRFLLKHRIQAKYLPRTIIKMRRGGISNASLKNRLRANQEDQKAWEINGLKPHPFTLILKPLRKLSQFI
jgi:glycosyltransferase involved in cell wall biosynthesis